MTARRIVFVARADAAPPPEEGLAPVVLDTAWTPPPGSRPDLIPLRTLVGAVLIRDDLFAESLDRVDRWADEADLVDRLLTDDDVSYWWRLRERHWHWLHERLIWVRILAELGIKKGDPDAVLPQVIAPEDEPALADVIRVLAGHPDRASGPGVDRPPDGLPPPRTFGRRLLRRVVGAVGRPAGRPAAADRRQGLEDRERELSRRLAGLQASHGPRVLVLSHSGIRHAIDVDGRAVLVDPILGPVVDRLRGSGIEALVVALGLDHRRDEDWPTIAADPNLLPQSLLSTRWKDSGAPAEATASDELSTRLEGAAGIALDVDGIDLGPLLLAGIRAAAGSQAPAEAGRARRIRVLLDELRPDAVVLTHEGIRLPWLVAARAAAIPLFAVQHGVIYPTHPGYAHPSDHGLVLPVGTFVYGDYERRALLEAGAFPPGSVIVAGSPRLDLDVAVGRFDPKDRGVRGEVRRELRVADGDRLVVVSTVNVEFNRRFHVTESIARLLAGPLPAIHIVFKQHPGESDEGPYRAIVEGLATAGGYRPPPMSVVRTVDLYRLLRAADAHVGLYSTVLTDAVAVGATNLIDVGPAKHDILGYVAAGVARPVRTAADVLDALDHPRPVDPAARRAFLEDHFRPGDASARIVSTITDRIGATPGALRG